MASVSAPPFPSHTPYKDSNPRTSSSRNPKFFSPPLKKSSALLHIHRAPDSLRCRCQNRSDSSSPLEDNNVDRGWNSQFQNVVKSVIKRIEDYLNSNRESDASVAELEEKEDERKEEVEENVEDWDWERWKKHFEEVEEQERIVAVLKSQIGNAVNREEYECASKLKVAMAAAATNDVVGKVVTHFNRAIEEERYQDAAFFRDSAGAGLMGWWAGISEDSDDPYGRIIHIGVEHGRYVARSFSPRHLATATRGVPLFEIFLTKGSKGEYKQQVVYLKRNGGKIDYPTNSSNLLDPSSNISKLNESTDVKSERSAPSTEDIDDDSDAAEGLSGVQNILRDMMPGEVTVLKVTATDKVSKDFISKVIEQIIEDEEDEEDEDEGKDIELEGVDTDNDNDNDDEDDDDDDVKAESQEDEVEIEIIDARDGDSVNGQEGSEMSVEVVIGGRLRNFSGNTRAKSLLRVPARLDKKDRLSFSFSIEEDGKQVEGGGKEHASADKSATGQGQRSISSVMSNLAKFAINREKIPMKVLKDVEELISLTINQAKSRQPLSGTTTFKRIEIPASSDLLSGLYIGANGLYTSEVIHLSRKFGQWKEDGVKQKRSSLEFYEYVEALKLTGDPHVPAGQVAFRAKVGKQYQLPHKGIIPEEFGVVARYKGQGRLADPGFKNPRWVDGELVILDGKYIKGGPVVGFVYWAPDYHFLVFFNRLRLPE